MTDLYELRELTRQLRQHLQWQAVPLSGVVPATEEAHEAVMVRQRERERATLARALADPAPATPPRSLAAAAGAPTAQQAPRKAATPALWKDDAFAAASPRPTFAPTAQTTAESLETVRADLGDCERCPLHSGRTNIVFGVGNPNARLMFIGEGPGFNEDRLGEPFVGKAGELLDKMIKAMTLSRQEVYIANVIKCRPPNNRDPEPAEVAHCAPFLDRQIHSVQPDVIVALGKFAANYLTNSTGALSQVRGRWHSWNGIPVMPTFHPAYLLRQERDKGKAWEDLKLVMQRLGLEIPSRRSR